MAWRLLWMLRPFCFIADVQPGFIKRRQLLLNVLRIETSDKIFCLLCTVAAMVFLDMKNAFPSVGRYFLFLILHICGAERWWLAAVIALYRDYRHWILIGGKRYLAGVALALAGRVLFHDGSSAIRPSCESVIGDAMIFVGARYPLGRHGLSIKRLWIGFFPQRFSAAKAGSIHSAAERAYWFPALAWTSWASSS